ncbi:MAG: ribosome biogenesis GTP-binding protein YihA/YsxC [Bacteroidales bacterium]|nr:ribosome biogenesis GTP-binding protein YihA/YsxC [Bacteroidales bacterium]MDD4656922.1 ribosome biogenesis GTP-binding protein YihA/YsxC [Bacteroidales bacterium]
MKISQAIFAGSSKKLDDRPKQRLPEFAFIGRSNVGKSSLINMLCNVGKLAHTSSKPGKTRLINHFMINESWYLVDLPGYGYAKVSKKERENLANINHGYLNGSKELLNLFVLIDSRHDIQTIDLNFINKLGEAGVPFSIIYTKTDKQGVNALDRQIERNNTTLLQYWEELPPFFATSAETGFGRDKILDYIEKLINNINS